MLIKYKPLSKIKCLSFAVMSLLKSNNKTEPHTVEPHDVLQRVQVLNISLVTTEDLGPRTKIIRKVFSILLPHFTVPTQHVDLLVEGNVIGRPVTCGKEM